MVRLRWLILLLLLASVGTAGAQGTCRRIKSNPQNLVQCTTISTSPVTVAIANTGRCQLFVYNNSANPMNCTDADADGSPTAANGTPVPGGQFRALGQEGQGRWQCIRSAAADAQACTMEALP